MALQNQFVTSFSELYIRAGAFTDASGFTVRDGVTTGAVPTANDVRNWFSDTGINAVAKVENYTVVAGTPAAGSTIFNIVASDGEILDTVTAVNAGTTLPGILTAITTALAGSEFVTSAVGSSPDVLVAFNADAGNAEVILVSSTAGVDSFAVSTIRTGVVAFTSGAGATIQIPLVMEIGTLSNEATIIDVPTFGEEFRGKLRGQLDGGQLDVQLYWAPREAVHLAIRQFAQRGTAVSVGIRWRPTSDAASVDTELVVFDSFVSSFGIDTTFDDVAKVSATMVVDGAEHFASGDVADSSL